MDVSESEKKIDRIEEIAEEPSDVLEVIQLLKDIENESDYNMLLGTAFYRHGDISE